eukprot:109358-Hanusia_phi.AAC.1
MISGMQQAQEGVDSLPMPGPAARAVEQLTLQRQQRCLSSSHDDEDGGRDSLVGIEPVEEGRGLGVAGRPRREPCRERERLTCTRIVAVQACWKGPGQGQPSQGP